MKITLRKAEQLKENLSRILKDAILVIRFDGLANKEIVHLKREAFSCMENTTQKEEGVLEGKCTLTEYVAFIEDMIREERILNNLIIQAKAELCDDRCYATITANDNIHSLRERLSAVLNMREKEEKKVDETGYVINKAGEQVSYRYKKSVIKTLEYDRELIKKKIQELIEEEDRYQIKKELKELEANIEYEGKYIYSTVSDNLSLFLGRKVLLTE